MRNNFEEISNDKLDLGLNPVDPGVVPGHVDLVPVNVHGNHPITGLGKLDCIATNTTECVHNKSTTANLGNVFGNLLRGN